MPEDEKPYEASARSRFDSPEFYAVFQNILRTLKLFQSVRGALDRPGFSKDLKAIAAATSEEFVQAALHESRPRSNEDLIHTAGCEKVCTALRHLLFSTATVPLTDGYRMRSRVLCVGPIIEEFKGVKLSRSLLSMIPETMASLDSTTRAKQLRQPGQSSVGSNAAGTM